MSVFVWEDSNRNHIGKHKITTGEAEEVSLNFPMELDSYIVDGELRFEELGETKAGRILKIVSVIRDEKVRILTAFDAPPSLKRLYLESRFKNRQ